MVRVASIVQLERYQLTIQKLYPYLLLVIIALPALTLHLTAHPAPWFDEGYKTNAARTLAERGVYGTYTSAGFLPFDPGISSGPIDIIALAFSFKLFGTGIVQARFVIVVFALLALLCLYAISVAIYGRSAGLFITLVVLAIPTIHDARFLFVGRQVLGETPALAMLLLGFWLWFKSWENESWALGGLAGLVLGLGLLSKTQVGIALGPTMLLIGAGRVLTRQARVIGTITPIATMLGVIGIWTLLGRLLVSEQARRDNSQLLLDAIQSNLLTDLAGRTLSAGALVIVALLGLGVLAYGWRRLYRPAGRQVATDRQWAEATIALFVLLSAIWFALLSVGWPRYAYVGLTAGLILIGKLIWDIFQWMHTWVESRVGHTIQAYQLALGSLALIALFTNSYPLLRNDQDTQAQGMADYIYAYVPRDAIVESWEWELDALSGHWEYHHPQQRYLFLAIRQFSHQQTVFDLHYDLLQANPEYLVTGPFSNWTHIYDDQTVARHFKKLAEIGAYQIYQRSR